MTQTELKVVETHDPAMAKVVLINGGSTGLGLAMAQDFARRGHTVVVSSHNPENLAFAGRRMAELGYEVEAEQCDCRDRDQVVDLVRRVQERHGRIDVLVNCAGIIKVGPVDSLVLSDFEDAMATMYWGMVYATLEVLPLMQARGAGRIVNITSIGGVMSVPHLLPYSAAKAAAIGFSKGLGSELSGTGVSVLTVVPGLMRTGSFLNARFTGQEAKEFGWFTMLSSLPGVSVSAESSARRIVRAALGSESLLTLSLPANVAARAQGTMPGTVVKLLGLQNRLMPKPEGLPGFDLQGRQIDSGVNGSLVKKLSYFGYKAAAKLQRPKSDGENRSERIEQAGG
ncbi:MAG TPA: SDR family oxidoreductase [Dehalococcoidia bacterium]|nr:SDR family oxidoreductase [Dehalococcoidia bacterium]